MIKQLWQQLGILVFWVGWPLLWLQLRWTKRTRAVIISSENKVLLVKGWIGSGEWILPGGGLHRGEEASAGAVREVYEETGIMLEATRLTLVNQSLVNEYGLKFHCKLFSIKLSNEPDLRPQKLEITDVTWMPLADARGLSPLTVKLLAPWTVD